MEAFADRVGSIGDGVDELTLCCPFPLSFCRQAEAFACLPSEQRDELLNFFDAGGVFNPPTAYITFRIRHRSMPEGIASSSATD